MRWLNTRVHLDEYEHPAAVQPDKFFTSAAPIETACPTCGQPYFARIPVGYDDWAIEADERVAEERLAAECPDHPHAFDSGDWGFDDIWGKIRGE